MGTTSIDNLTYQLDYKSGLYMLNRMPTCDLISTLIDDVRYVYGIEEDENGVHLFSGDPNLNALHRDSKAYLQWWTLNNPSERGERSLYNFLSFYGQIVKEQPDCTWIKVNEGFADLAEYIQSYTESIGYHNDNPLINRKLRVNNGEVSCTDGELFVEINGNVSMIKLIDIFFVPKDILMKWLIPDYMTVGDAYASVSFYHDRLVEAIDYLSSNACISNVDALRRKLESLSKEIIKSLDGLDPLKEV